MSAADLLAVGHRAGLRLPRNSDVVELQRLAMQPEVRSTWRTRGDYWSPADFQQRLSSDPQLALVVTDVRDEEVLGLAELHDLDLVDRRAQFALLVAPAAWSSPLAAEASVLFLRHAFDVLPLEKVACTVQSGNVRVVRALRRLLEHEGTLRRHLNVHGTWSDLEVFALWRADLPAIEARLRLPAVPVGGDRG